MSLIAETANPLLEQALLAKLQRHGEPPGALGKLEPVAVRLGLLQNSLMPRFREPQLLLFAADHGLAVEDGAAARQRPTDQQVQSVLRGEAPVAALARQTGLALSVIDAGMASRVAPHERLHARKIAHGSRSCRLVPAMTVDQAHAAIRAGMEIADALPGNLLACAGLGVGSHESAALVLARLGEVDVRDLLRSDAEMPAEHLARLGSFADAALARHREASDPVEVLAAFGGFETAQMVGAMLVAASKRHLVMVDGIVACAALMVAARISPPATDYAVFCRSTRHQGLDRAMALFHATAMLDLGLDTLDGAGACLAWPLVRTAAAMLVDEVPGDSRPGGLDSGMPAGQGLASTVAMGMAATAPTEPNPFA